MITLAIVYSIIGLAACFTMLTIQRVYDVREEVSLFMGPVVALILWPIAIPLMFAFFLICAMSGLADKAAERIKANRNKK